MKRLLALVTIFALAAAPLATRLEAAAATGAGLAVPVSGVAPGGAGSFNGTLRIQRFVSSGGQIVAQGVLTGIATNTTTAVSESIVRTISAPVTLGNPAAGPTAAAISAQATCDILHLVLGPLHLDLLGLVIDLNQVVLDITAQRGPGNLLGNLLCAITGLLDGGGTATQISNLLNQVLAILQGL
jgi:hypothetical protein